MNQAVRRSNVAARWKHTRQKSGEKPLHAVRFARIFKHPPFLQSSGGDWCRMLPFIGCKCAGTGSPFLVSSIPTRPFGLSGPSKDRSMVFEVRKRFGKAGMSQVSGQQESNNALELLSFWRNAFGTDIGFPLRPGCATSCLHPHLMTIW